VSRITVGKWMIVLGIIGLVVFHFALFIKVEGVK
jgi:hypothetical protein